MKKNFDIIILFLGGNDLVEGCNIADLYENLKTLAEDLKNTIIPKFGVFLLEPEARLGNPKYISQKGYYRLRNSLVRKFKNRKELRSWTLVGKGLNLNHIGKDGVHFNKGGRQKFKEIIQDHLRENIEVSLRSIERKTADKQSPSTSKIKVDNKKLHKNKSDSKRSQKQGEKRSLENSSTKKRKGKDNKGKTYTKTKLKKD